MLSNFSCYSNSRPVRHVIVTVSSIQDQFSFVLFFWVPTADIFACIYGGFHHSECMTNAPNECPTHNKLVSSWEFTVYSTKNPMTRCRKRQFHIQKQDIAARLHIQKQIFKTNRQQEEYLENIIQQYLHMEYQFLEFILHGFPASNSLLAAK